MFTSAVVRVLYFWLKRWSVVSWRQFITRHLATKYMATRAYLPPIRARGGAADNGHGESDPLRNPEATFSTDVEGFLKEWSSVLSAKLFNVLGAIPAIFVVHATFGPVAVAAILVLVLVVFRCTQALMTPVMTAEKRRSSTEGMTLSLTRWQCGFLTSDACTLRATSTVAWCCYLCSEQRRNHRVHGHNTCGVPYGCTSCALFTCVPVLAPISRLGVSLRTVARCLAMLCVAASSSTRLHRRYPGAALAQDQAPAAQQVVPRRAHPDRVLPGCVADVGCTVAGACLPDSGVNAWGGRRLRGCRCTHRGCTKRGSGADDTVRVFVRVCAHGAGANIREPGYVLCRCPPHHDRRRRHGCGCSKPGKAVGRRCRGRRPSRGYGRGNVGRRHGVGAVAWWLGRRCVHSWAVPRPGCRFRVCYHWTQVRGSRLRAVSRAED